MLCKMFASHVVILLLVVSTSLVFSKKTTTPSTKDVEEDLIPTKEKNVESSRHQRPESNLKPRIKGRRGEGRYSLHKDEEKEEDDEFVKAGLAFSKKTTTPSTQNIEELIESSRLQPSESKLKTRYKGRRGEGRYVLHEDEGEGRRDGEFIEEVGNEEHEENEEDRGYHNEDKKLDDETLEDYSIKGTDLAFKEGGASFDKHHKDLATQNKENEHVNEHDEGEKFGAEALKEHKLGKHREKSVGHKKHGFKNVYHKEEYGDHKTFHDEFLDNDHHHEYDDQHENRKLEGGRFSKGYWKEGENKELDEGDENHAWGKGGHDSQHDAKYEEGGHITGHRQGHKKREGHHEASGHKHKQSKHKVKKGEVPSHSTNHHHDEHQPQYYERTNKPYGGKEDYSKVLSPDIDLPHKTHKSHKSGKGFSYPKVDLADIGEDHQNSYPYNKVPESFSSEDTIDEDLYPKEYRTHARLPEPKDYEPIRKELPRHPPVVNHVRVSKPLPASENHSFYYRRPQTEIVEQIPLKEEKPILRVPQLPDSERPPLVVQHSPKQNHNFQHYNPPHHHQPGVFPTQLSGPNPSHHHHDDRNHLHGDRNHHHRHVVVSQPVGNHEPRDHYQNHYHTTPSKPYPWWKHTGRPGDSVQASSQHRFGHERAPHQYSSWIPQNKFRYSEPYESRHHYGTTRVPEFQNVHQQY